MRACNCEQAQALVAEREKYKLQALNFARQLMEAKAKLAAIHHVTAQNAVIIAPNKPGELPTVSTGDSNVPQDSALPEFQQAGTLQEPTDGRPHILP